MHNLSVICMLLSTSKFIQKGFPGLHVHTYTLNPVVTYSVFLFYHDTFSRVTLTCWMTLIDCSCVINEQELNIPILDMPAQMWKAIWAKQPSQEKHLALSHKAQHLGVRVREDKKDNQTGRWWDREREGDRYGDTNMIIYISLFLNKMEKALCLGEWYHQIVLM